MSIPASLFATAPRVIPQKIRSIPVGARVCISRNQNRKIHLNTVAQRDGVRYENRIGKYLSGFQYSHGCELHSHVWFDVGNCSAQTDFFLTFPSHSVILFEVKKTWVDTTNQLSFYKQLLIEIGYGPVTCCTICSNLTPDTPRDGVIQSFNDITEGAIWQLRL